MSPTFTPIRLTIIDFLGVFLPGMVWTVLFFTLREMVSPQWNIKPTDPLKVAFFIATLPKELSGHEYGAPFYVGLALLSILIGYFNMALSTYPAEWISIRVPSFIIIIIMIIKVLFVYLFKCPCKIQKIHQKIQKKIDNRENKPRVLEFFPFKDYYEKEQKFLYSSIKKIVNAELQIQEESDNVKIEKLASYQPFEICKRLLKIRQPVLWEEAQYREAQVRMLASLFLASLFNLILSTLAIKEEPSWIFTSLVITIIVGQTFRKRRFREVEDVYISTLLVRNSVLPSSNSNSDKIK
jgi:hypothetical protein